MPSFDVVSELDKHELTNAVDNAIKELDRRFDLKGKCSFEAKDKSVTLTAEADFMLEQMLDILRSNLVKRKVDSQCVRPCRRSVGSSALRRFVSRPGNVGPRRPGRNLQARPVSVAEGRGVFSRNGGNAWN